MRELDLVVDAWRVALREGRPGVIATVVGVRGSAYRRPGARMLILQDGTRVGSISGGCLEGDVCRKAWWLTEDGRSAVRVYDTTSDEDAVWEFGLGCNGVVEVLLERTDAPEAVRTLEFLEHCRHTRKPGAIATLVKGGSPGDRVFVAHNGRATGTLKEDAILDHAWEALQMGKTCLLNTGDREILLETIAPPVPLTIFGAGHDAIPLVEIAKHLGWHVTVADGRPAYAVPARFPHADQIDLIRGENPIENLEIGTESVVVVMTHNYPMDCAILRETLPRNPKFVGVLGPRQRTCRLLRDAGVMQFESKVHAPVGLDIGADAPETIALSIVAEIHAVLAGRSGRMLRERNDSIYEPIAEVRLGEASLAAYAE